MNTKIYLGGNIGLIPETEFEKDYLETHYPAGTKLVVTWGLTDSVASMGLSKPSKKGSLSEDLEKATKKKRSK